jgi:hypothetical protein
MAWLVAAPAVLLAVTYTFAAALAHGSPSPRTVLSFVTAYGQTGYWGHGASLLTLKQAVAGVLRAIANVESLFLASGDSSLEWWVSVSVVAVVSWLGFRSLLFLARRKPRELQREVWLHCVALSAWVSVHSIFVFWWYPANIEFWIAVLPGVAFLVVAAGERSALNRALVGLLIICSLYLGPGTAQGGANPDEEKRFAEIMASLVRPGDLIVLVSGRTAVYQRFYTEAEVAGLQSVARRVESSSAGGEVTSNELFEAVRRSSEEALAQGGRLWVEGRIFGGDFARKRALASVDPDALGREMRSLGAWLDCEVSGWPMKVLPGEGSGCVPSKGESERQEPAGDSSLPVR